MPTLVNSPIDSVKEDLRTVPETNETLSVFEAGCFREARRSATNLQKQNGGSYVHQLFRFPYYNSINYISFTF